MTTTKQARQMKDSSLLGAIEEIRGYLRNDALDASIAAEYASSLDVLVSEACRREIR